MKKVRLGVRIVLACAFICLAAQGVPCTHSAALAEELPSRQSTPPTQSADIPLERDDSSVSSSPAEPRREQLEGKPPVLSPDRHEKPYILSDITVWSEKPSLPFATRLDRRLAERTPGTFSDPVRATISVLPGVTCRDELFLRPSVNGGLPDWVSVYYGGFSDCYPYILYGTSSIANGQFDQLRLLKGAFPVEYGDALAGVVLIEPKRTVARNVSGSFSLDFVKSSFNVSGPLKQYSYALSCETSFYDKVLGPLRNESYPGSYSVMSSISRVLGRSLLSLRTFYALGGIDTRLEPTTDRYTSATARSRTLKKRHELTIQETGARATHTTSVGYFYDNEGYDAVNGLMGRDAGALNDFSADISLKAESFGITHKSTLQITDWHVVDIGASLRKEEVSQFTSTEGWNFVPLFNTGRDDIADTSLAHSDQTLTYWKYALFAQDRHMLGGYEVTLGARCDALNSSFAPALRASVERRFDNLTFRIAGGQYLRFPISGTFREGKLAGLVRSYTEPERAIHLVVGCDARIGPATVTVDLNKQEYSDLVIRDSYGTESRGGTGSLRSIDVTVSSPMDNENCWAYVTTSFGRADIMDMPTDWDQSVIGKAVCFARLARSLELTTRLFYGSGLAYTPLLVRTPLIDASSAPVTDETGQVVYRAVWGEGNSARLPTQFRLDLRIARNWAPFGRNARLFVEGLNLTNHKNISGVDYLDYYSRTVYRTNVPRAANVGCEFRF
jgi:hypothetical protein